jgi:hypothetical protein
MDKFAVTKRGYHVPSGKNDAVVEGKIENRANCNRWYVLG